MDSDPNARWIDLHGFVLPGWIDAVDIALVACFVWLAIRYLRRARSRAALVGVAATGAVYLLASALGLALATTILEGFFAGLIIVLVIVFQDDLRRFFEQIGSWRRDGTRSNAEEATLDLLTRAVVRLAGTRTGALIVLPGREPIERHTEGGVVLEGRVSEPLLMSLFDSSSPGHDGAVLIRGPIVERFAVHLPLSADHTQLGQGGTRHAAALGLAERSDATCIAVSEERGTVSVARNGSIHLLAHPEDLITELQQAERTETVVRRSWWQGRLGLDSAAAVAIAVALWAVFVPGSDIEEVQLMAPVTINNIPEDLELETIEPEALEVTVRGLRRDLVLARRGGIKVQIDAYLARLGRRTFSVTAQDVVTPDSISAVDLNPKRVRLSMRRTAAQTDEAPP